MTAVRPSARCLSLSVESQARELFFAYYVTSRCWDFLMPYYQKDPPQHLALAIEAVSFAYLWHQLGSDAALVKARERYVSALTMTNRAVRSPKGATRDTTLMASLLLDLFEKITSSTVQHDSLWTSHANGALALVSHRGLEHFQDAFEFSMLVRLSTHYTIGCLSSHSSVPHELHLIHAYIGQRLGYQSPMWQFTDLIARYANLCHNIRGDKMSREELFARSLALDESFHQFDNQLPPSWRYSSIEVEHESNVVFGSQLDLYPSSKICQALNKLRVIRILLNECLLEHVVASSARDEYLPLRVMAHNTIESMVGEICSSIPQYLDCDDAARQKLPSSERSQVPIHTNHLIPRPNAGRDSHIHTLNHQLECYTLIFPLYVVGRLKSFSEARRWVIEQLDRISGHFRIRNADVVAQMLEQDTSMSPWEVYAMLGSYAFAS